MTEARFLLLPYGVVLLLTAGVLCLLGRVLQRVVGWRVDNPYAAWLANGFVGYLVAQTIFAAVCTGGVTVNLVFIPILALAWGEVRKKQSTLVSADVLPARSAGSVAGPALAALAAVFVWSWWTLFTGFTDVIADYGYTDYILYSRIAQQIGTNGFENGFYFLNDYDASYHGAEPYHYFDLWGASAVATIFPLNHYLTLKLVIYPLFFWFVFLGYGALVTERNTPWRSFLMLILLLFVGGVYFAAYQRYPFLQALTNLQSSVLKPSISKLSYFYVFLVSAVVLYRHGQTSLALLCLCALPVANIVAFPVWCAAGGMLVIVYAMKGMPARRFWRQVLYIAVPVAGVAAFYAIFQQNELGLAGSEISAPAKMLRQTAGGFQWRTRFNIVVGGVLHMVILYLPVALPLLLFACVNKIRPVRQYFVPLGMAALCVLIGVSGWALLYQELNSFQLFSNISMVCLNILVAVGVIYVYNRRADKTMKYSMLCLAVMLVIVSAQGVQAASRLHVPDVHSIGYLKEVQRAVAQTRVRKGVSIKDAGVLQDIFSKYNAVYPLGDYLAVLQEGVSIVNIGDFNTPIDSSSALAQYRSVKAIQNGLFYKQIMQAYGKIPAPAVIENEQVTFIRKHHIEFIILSAHAVLPAALTPTIARTITDPHSGERFVLLK